MNEEERKERLNRIVVKGFKSIKECDLSLSNINVLIGANGAGKSNFVLLFEMLKKIMDKELAVFAGQKGIDNLLYGGKKATDKIVAEFYVAQDSYAFMLVPTENESLVFYNEKGISGDGTVILSAEGHGESIWAYDGQKGGGMLQSLLRFGIYHFHDTSPSAKIKSGHNISNNVVLLNDARNLAAFLYRLRESHGVCYQNILKAIQRIAPYFKDFDLKPNENNSEHIALRWREVGRDDTLFASQLSDGTLRFVCLATLLLQPTELQPAIIIIDEPELGLHPYAIAIFAELVKKVAIKKQIILATQSVDLLDCFEPEDVIVVDRGENGSEFRRLDAAKLAAWLEDDYSLGELWNKNIFGGRVSR
ncbi:MAG: AAA family ATPase [Treponema sp.]|nr:AAA family ATPase [Treponema sp.]